MPRNDGFTFLAYPVQHHANEDKLDQIRALLGPWQRGMNHIATTLRRTLLEGAKLPTFIDTKSMPYYLSQRMWKSVFNQVKGSISSWLELLVIQVRNYIGSRFRNDPRAKELYRINKSKKWWEKPEDSQFSAEDLALSRAMVKAAQRRVKFPNLSRVRTMVMNATVANTEEATASLHFDNWFRISTLCKRHPVLIPFTINSYAAEAPGEWSSVVQVHIGPPDKKGLHAPVRFSRLKKIAIAQPREPKWALGLDWGLKSIFSTHDGMLVGQRLFSWLQDRDVELEALTAELNRQKVKLKENSRYVALNRRIRDYVANEINRVLNRLVADDDISELVVERLDFRHKGLSRRMNRIISRAGRGAVSRKLAALEIHEGVKVTKVNPAYTSQECSGCGYVSRENRNGVRFHCRFCGKSLHADINAARNIVERRSRHANVWERMPVRQVRGVVDSDFRRRWNCGTNLSSRQSRPNSGARPSSNRRRTGNYGS